MANNPYLAPSPMVPAFLVISGITNAIKPQVTVTTANTYVIGQVVRFSVPFDYGMFQINGLSGAILSVNNTNLIFTVDVNTSNFDIFTAPSGLAQPATLSPSGVRNIYNFVQSPFHSLNGNVGN